MGKGRAVAIELNDVVRRELTALTRKHGAPQALAERAGGGWRPEEQRDRLEAWHLHAHGRHLAEPLCRARNGRSPRRAAARRTTRDWRRRDREHDPQNVGDATKGWHTLEPQEHG